MPGAARAKLRTSSRDVRLAGFGLFDTVHSGHATCCTLAFITRFERPRTALALRQLWYVSV